MPFGKWGFPFGKSWGVYPPSVPGAGAYLFGKFGKPFWGKWGI